MEKIDFGKLSQILFCLLFFVLAVFVFFRYVFFWIFPFIVAWCIAMLTRPIARRLSRRTRIPIKLASPLVMLLTLALFGFIVFSACYRLFYELQRLIVWVSEDSGDISQRVEEIMGYFSNIGSNVPLIDNLENIDGLRNIRQNFDAALEKLFSGALTSLSSGIPAMLARLFSALPSLFLGFIVTVIACFYFALDIDRLHISIVSVLPEKIGKKLPVLKQKVAETLVKYVKSYLILLILTFLELFIGFSVLKLEYAFLLALIIAFVDILPVFGVGSVLVPWAIIMLFMKNFYLGIGLLVVYLIITVVRQFAEPRIVGKSLGLHPLLTLVAMYVGFEVFGIIGMFLAPTVLIIIKPIFDLKAKSNS